MTKEKLLNYLLVNTNQYFIGAENFEITEPVLDGLIWQALNMWGENYPAIVIVPIAIQNSKTQLTYLTDSFGDKRQIFGITGIYFDDYTKVGWDGAKEALKIPYEWRYDDLRNVLYFPSAMSPQVYYIEAICQPILEDVNDNEKPFLDIMVGLSLIYIGHNRNDFALSELPFEIQDLRDEGQAIIDKALEDMEKQDDTNWHLAIELA